MRFQLKIIFGYNRHYRASKKAYLFSKFLLTYLFIKTVFSYCQSVKCPILLLSTPCRCCYFIIRLITCNKKAPKYNKICAHLCSSQLSPNCHDWRSVCPDIENQIENAKNDSVNVDISFFS